MFFLFILGISEAATQELASPPLPFSLGVSPSLAIPILDSADYFTVGGGMGLDLSYQFPDSIFFVQGGLDYAYSPTSVVHTVSLATANVGGGVSFPVAPIFSFFAYGKVGYWYATYNDDTSVYSTNPFIAAGAGIRCALGPVISLGAGAEYQYHAGLCQGLNVSIGTNITLGSGSTAGTDLEFHSTFTDAFPVFFKYYDDHPIGKLEIENRTTAVVSNVRVQFNIKQYMDEPKEVTLPGTIPPGDTAQMDIYALLTDTILTVTEGTKSAAQLVITYDANGEHHEEKRVVTVSFFGRNAMTWDDNRKAAAYVTAKDPQVLGFSRSVTSSIQNSETRSINQNLQAAIALHEALDLYGLNYVPNPTTPYTQASKQKGVVDFLQFPRETFEFKSGDCSDISILYSALLQAVGIDTAFITVPGHIFVAFTTKLTPEQASSALIPESEYIAYQGKVWIPVEVTMRHKGFLKAWELGAKEWNESNPTGQAGFYPVQDAWKVYQPVGIPGVAGQVATPPMDQVLASYCAESNRYVDSSTYPQIQKLQAEIQATGSVAATNKLGVLYAKYGQMEKAEVEFRRALEQEPFLPAILNLGNLYFIQDQWKNALKYYQQALGIDGKNPRVLLAIAKADQQLSMFDDMRQKYDQLKTLDPELAGEFASLGEGSAAGGRASDIATERRNVVWEDQ